MNKNSFLPSIFTVIVVLAMSALWTVPARADDITPPSNDPAAVSQPTDDGSTSSQPIDTVTGGQNVESTSAADQASPIPSDSSVPASADSGISAPDPSVGQSSDTNAGTSVEAPVDAATTTEPIDPLAQVPDGTQLVVTDQSGNPVPLATQEATQIIATGDPMWCPAGATPGGAGCSPSLTNFNDPDPNVGLIAWLGAHSSLLNVNGVIWIAGGYNSSTMETFSSTAVVIDGNASSLGNMENFTLTVTGGWTGTGTVVDSTNPSNFDGTTLSIIHWNNDVTLSDIVVENVSGAGNTALTVTTSKKISLTRMEVGDTSGAHANDGPGALLDNHAGTGDVNVTSSQFAYNGGGTGLYIHSAGIITLNSVIADHNSGDGANLDNSGVAIGKNVALTTGTFEFNSNGGSGLSILSKGQITLKDIDAIDNTADGAHLDNHLATAPMAITLTGSNVFSGNDGNGLYAFSVGAITASNLTATSNGSANGDWGAWLDNSLATLAQLVTLTGSDQFNFNYAGLYIASKGAITLNAVMASNNWGDTGADNTASGAQLDNCLSSGPLCTGSANVTFTGNNFFNDNYRSGLSVSSGGVILINSLAANRNGHDDGTPANSGGFGAILDNSDAITAKALTLTGTNTFNDNFNDGLDALSHGAIVISSLTANNNEQGDGTYLDNQWSGIPGALTVTGNSTFNNNGGDGLAVYSAGAITLNNLTANHNGQRHDDATSCSLCEGFGVFLNNGLAPTVHQKVTLTGINNFDHNWFSGIEIESYGPISVNSLSSTNNGQGGYDFWGYGAILDNCNASGPACINAAPQTLVLTGTNYFYGNHDSGLEAYSLGTITINSLDSEKSENGWGAYLENDFTTSIGTITLTGDNIFLDNYYDGVVALSFGAISMSNLDSEGNGVSAAPDVYGAYLVNSGAGGPKPIALTGTNIFDGNYAGGLYVETKGAITLANITASNSQVGDGATLDNHFSGLLTPQIVTFTGVNVFNGNNGSGLDVTSYGAITLSNMTANDNGWGGSGYGVLLDNHNATTPAVVTITGNSVFDGNGTDGVNINSKGVITLNMMEANSNTGNGVTLNNDYSGSVGGVTLLGHGCMFNLNSGYGCMDANFGNGLDINSRGAIAISMIVVQHSGGYGANLVNTNGTAGVTFSTTTGFDAANRFYSNDSYGLSVSTNGAIIASNLRARYNTGDFGATLDNSNPGAPQVVTLTGAWNVFTDNGADGLDINTKGVITINNLEADNNSGFGAFLDNTNVAPTLPQNVTLTGNNIFKNNGQTGLQIFTYGIVAASNLNADGNGTAHPAGGGYGAYLVNYWNGITPPTTLATLTPKAVTLTGNNTFTNNWGDGLNVVSKAVITANNLTANGNTGRGAYLNNKSGAGSLGGVVLTGTNDFESNSKLGLEVYSQGNIAINNLTADWNEGSSVSNSAGSFNVGGVYLDNHSLIATPVSVSLTGANNFLGNGNSTSHLGKGLLVYSDGAITLNNVTAYWNEEEGAYLDNAAYHHDVTLPAITLTGLNEFLWNGTVSLKDGLYFNSVGAVNISKLRSDANGGSGIRGTTTGIITLTCSSINKNGARGWSLTGGSINLTGVFGYGNTSANFTNVAPTVVRTCP